MLLSVPRGAVLPPPYPSVCCCADWTKVIAADKIPEIGGVVLKDLSLNSAALAKLSSSGTGVPGVVAGTSDTSSFSCNHPLYASR